ncbi:hypothetical protein AV545_02045 [Paenibacillus jamilae]|nr:hypothetical protein AV545_02045 [Paenibacillus jamilae]
MFNSIIHKLFWSRAFDEVREAHRKMCYELGVKDGRNQVNKDNQFYKEFSNNTYIDEWHLQ